MRLRPVRASGIDGGSAQTTGRCPVLLYGGLSALRSVKKLFSLCALGYSASKKELTKKKSKKNSRLGCFSKFIEHFAFSRFGGTSLTLYSSETCKLKKVMLKIKI
jgi:hypothetical protein